jgi:hypothetical protein
MQPSTPPKIIAVEVVSTQPTPADRKAIDYLSVQTSRPLPQIAYIVKIRLATMPPATSHGWALYVNGFRIPKYWEYKNGIYFKVFDPQFFADHHGQLLRFSQNGIDFVETGKKLARPSSEKGRSKNKSKPKAKSKEDTTTLPLQSEVLT